MNATYWAPEECFRIAHRLVNSHHGHALHLSSRSKNILINIAWEIGSWTHSLRRAGEYYFSLPLLLGFYFSSFFHLLPYVRLSLSHLREFCNHFFQSQILSATLKVSKSTISNLANAKFWTDLHPIQYTFHQSRGWFLNKRYVCILLPKVSSIILTYGHETNPLTITLKQPAKQYIQCQ